MHPHLLTVVVVAVVAAVVGLGFGRVSSPPAADAQSSNRAVVKELKRLNKRVALLWIESKDTSSKLGDIRLVLQDGFGTGERKPVRVLLYLICWNTARSVQQQESC